jgi:Protein of unknown function (DUF3047)
MGGEVPHLEARVSRRWLRTAAAALVAFTAACAFAQAPLLQPLAGAPGALPLPWLVVGVPRQPHPLTRFALVDLDGRRALRVESNKSYGNLVHPLQELRGGSHLAWQWRVDEFVEQADLRTKAGDDAALKVCVFFDLPLARVPFVERQLLRLARSSTSEPLPAATVCYVWDPHLPVGTVLHNAYTHRVRYLVLQSGPARLREWTSERRNLSADFQALFGQESAERPPIVGVAVGADADNTQGRSLAYVSSLVLEP